MQITNTAAMTYSIASIVPREIASQSAYFINRNIGIQVAIKYPSPPKSMANNNGAHHTTVAVVTAAKVLLQCADTHIVIAHNKSIARKSIPSVIHV